MQNRLVYTKYCLQKERSSQSRRHNGRHWSAGRTKPPSRSSMSVPQTLLPYAMMTRTGLFVEDSSGRGIDRILQPDVTQRLRGLRVVFYKALDQPLMPMSEGCQFHTVLLAVSLVVLFVLLMQCRAGGCRTELLVR